MIKTIFSSIILASTSFSQLEVGKADKTWHHQESDIAVDSKAVFGELENGFRYIIYPNSEPPGRMSVRLHVNAGSLDEADNQQGLAHFLEHMLFDGSKNFPPGELIKEMERIGIPFGSGANAYTSFDETVYMLDLPNLDKETVDFCFTVIRDYCDGASLVTEEIEAERGVILSEKNSRDSVNSRLRDQQFNFMMPDFLPSKRFPIGIEEVIKNCHPDRLREYYKAFYEPKRMTFVVVGDIDPEVYEKRIQETFKSLESPKKDTKTPDMGSITEPKTLTTGIFTDPEVDEDDITLTRVLETVSKPDTIANRHEKLKLDIANSIIATRFSKIAKEKNSPILAGSSYKVSWFDEITFGGVYITPAEGKWKESVKVLEQEFRRAIEHGFTNAEFKEATASILTSAEQAVDSYEKRKSAAIASTIIPTLNDRKVISNATENLRVVELLLKDLKSEQCHKAFNEFWDIPGKYLILTTKEANEDDKKQLLSLYQESEKTPVSAPEEKIVGEFAYSSFGEPSTISSEKFIEDLDFYQLTLSNGFKVNLKKTDFESGKVYLSARIGSGTSTISDYKPGLAEYSSTLMNLGGLKEHSTDDLRQIFSDKVVGLYFNFEEDAALFRGACNDDDLETQLQLLGAYLTAPGFRPEAHRQYIKAVPDQYEQIRQTLEGAFSSLSSFEHGQDPRFVTPTEEEAVNFKPEEAVNFFKTHVTGKPIELTLVGDFEIDAAKATILKILGADLAVKEDSKPAVIAIKSLPELGQTKEFHYSSKLDRAAAVVTWRSKGLTDNISEARRLRLVADILSNRIREKIREELGSSYSPYSYSSMNDTFENYGNLKAVSICVPEDMQKISKLVKEIADTFADEGATQDELDRVQKPAITGLESTLRDNSYWLSTVIASNQAQPRRLKWARSRTTDYTGITLKEVNELAAQYLKSSNSITYHVSPQSE